MIGSVEKPAYRFWDHNKYSPSVLCPVNGSCKHYWKLPACYYMEWVCLVRACYRYNSPHGNQHGIHWHSGSDNHSDILACNRPDPSIRSRELPNQQSSNHRKPRMKSPSPNKDSSEHCIRKSPAWDSNTTHTRDCNSSLFHNKHSRGKHRSAHTRVYNPRKRPRVLIHICRHISHCRPAIRVGSPAPIRVPQH